MAMHMFRNSLNNFQFILDNLLQNWYYIQLYMYTDDQPLIDEVESFAYSDIR